MLAKQSIRSVLWLNSSIFRRSLFTVRPVLLRPNYTFRQPTKMTSIKKIFPKNGAAPLAPYTPAVVAGNTIYVSGQIPIDNKGELVQGSIADKTRACAMNVKAILDEAGASMGNVVKCLVFIDDMANFAEMNEEYEKHFSHKPARSCVAVKQLPKGVPVEIECIAVI